MSQKCVKNSILKVLFLFIICLSFNLYSFTHMATSLTVCTSSQNYGISPSHHPVIRTANGNIVLFYFNSYLSYRVSPDNGNTWTSETTICSQGYNNQSFTYDLVADNSNNIYIVYQEGGYGTCQLKYLKLSYSSGTSYNMGTPFILQHQRDYSSYGYNETILIDDNGRIWVSYYVSGGGDPYYLTQNLIIRSTLDGVNWDYNYLKNTTATLAGNINAYTTAITVDSTAGFNYTAPHGGGYGHTLNIDDEWIDYVDKTATTFIGCTRSIGLKGFALLSGNIDSSATFVTAQSTLVSNLANPFPSSGTIFLAPGNKSGQTPADVLGGWPGEYMTYNGIDPTGTILSITGRGVNIHTVTLAGNIDAVTSNITVSSDLMVAGFPPSSYAKIENEWIKYVIDTPATAAPYINMKSCIRGATVYSGSVTLLTCAAAAHTDGTVLTFGLPVPFFQGGDPPATILLAGSSHANGAQVKQPTYGTGSFMFKWKGFPSMIYAKGNTGNVQWAFYDSTGSSWVTSSTNNALPFESWWVGNYTAVADTNDNIFVAYKNTGSTPGVYWTAGSTNVSNFSWSAQQRMSTSASDDFPQLTRNGSDIYLFWSNYLAANSYDIVYNRYSAGAWGTSTSITANGLNNLRPSVMADSAVNMQKGGVVPVFWLEGTAAPYNIKLNGVANSLSVTTVTPAHVQELVSNTITITGQGFFGVALSASVTAITIGSTAITNYTGFDDLVIRPVVLPASFTAGSYDLILANSSGTNCTYANKFVFTTGPTVTSLNPSSGINITPTTLTVTGTNFFAQGSTGVVTSIKLDDLGGGTFFTGFTAVSDTEIDKAVIPPGVKPGNYNVKVTSINGTNAISTVKFTVNGVPPTVTAVSPAIGTNLTVTTISITGTEFFSGTLSSYVNTIVFDDIDFTSISFNPATITDTTANAVVPAGIRAGTYNIQVTTIGGSNLTSTQTFAVTTAKPTVTNIQPTIGTDINPATVTISGTGFFGGFRTTRVSAVKLSDLAQTNFNLSAAVFSDTEIAGAVIPAGVLGGSYQVKAYTDGGNNTTSTVAYHVRTGPLVTGVTPVSTSNLAVATLTIIGSNFFAGSATSEVTFVKLDDPATTTLTITGAVIDDTSITGAKLPPGVAVGTYNIKVTTSVSTNNTSAMKFAVNTPEPTVTTFTPASGKGSAATTLSINGTGFKGGLSSSSVSAIQLDDASLTSLVFSSAVITDSTITGAVIPQGVAVGTYSIKVFTPGGNNTTSTSRFTVTVPDPLVYSSAPTSGTNLTTVTLTVNGYGFFGGISTGSSVVTAVKLVDTATGTITMTASGYSVSSDSTITGAILPSGRPVGNYDIRVSNTGGIYNTTSTQKYLVTTAAPTVVSVLPASGSNVSLTTLTVTGTGFFGGLPSNTVTAVKLDNSGTTALTIGSAVITDTSITGAVLPAGVVKGTYNVIVTAAGGTNTTSTQKIIISTPPPAVTNVTPASGLNLNETTVTLTGTGFFGGTATTNTVTAVALDDPGLTALDLTGSTVSDTQIKGVIIPRNIYPGTYNVKVTAAGGANSTSAKYIVTAPLPQVTSSNPLFGGDSGYRTVVISGSGFFAGLMTPQVSGVRLNDGANTVLDLGIANKTDSEIFNAIVPPGIAVGTYDVLVTTAGGTNATSQEKYSVLPGPRVSGVNPSTGTTLSPTTMTISGLNFYSGTGSPDISSVNIDNGPNTAFVLSSATITDTEIKKAILPSGIAVGTYNIIVTTSLGSNLTSSAKLVVLENETVANTVPGSDYTMNIYPVSGRIQIYLEQNTFGEGVKVTLTSKGVTVPVKDRDIIKLSTIGYEVKLNKSLQPLKKVRMTVSYRDADIAGFDESKLVLLRYDDTHARWIVLQSTVSPATNDITAYTDHFSKFALGQLVPAVNLTNARVYPNPFNPNKTYLTGGMLFDALTAQAWVGIYNIAGEEVWEGDDADGDGRVIWDGKNKANKPVAGGIYIALIKGGTEVKRLKVAIER